MYYDALNFTADYLPAPIRTGNALNFICVCVLPITLKRISITHTGRLLHVVYELFCTCTEVEDFDWQLETRE